MAGYISQPDATSVCNTFLPCLELYITYIMYIYKQRQFAATSDTALAPTRFLPLPPLHPLVLSSFRASSEVWFRLNSTRFESKSNQAMKHIYQMSVRPFCDSSLEQRRCGQPLYPSLLHHSSPPPTVAPRCENELRAMQQMLCVCRHEEPYICSTDMHQRPQ